MPSDDFRDGSGGGDSTCTARLGEGSTGPSLERVDKDVGGASKRIFCAVDKNLVCSPARPPGVIKPIPFARGVVGDSNGGELEGNSIVSSAAISIALDDGVL